MFCPKWRTMINKCIYQIIHRIANELGAEQAIMQEIENISNGSTEFFEPCCTTGSAKTSSIIRPISYNELHSTMKLYKDKTKPLEITMILNDKASRLFCTIIRTGMRELSSIRSTASSKRTKSSARSQRSPVNEIHVPKGLNKETEDDELTHNTTEEPHVPPPNRHVSPNGENHQDPPWYSNEQTIFLIKVDNHMSGINAVR